MLEGYNRELVSDKGDQAEWRIGHGDLATSVLRRGGAGDDLPATRPCRALPLCAGGGGGRAGVITALDGPAPLSRYVVAGSRPHDPERDGVGACPSTALGRNGAEIDGMIAAVEREAILRSVPDGAAQEFATDTAVAA